MTTVKEVTVDLWFSDPGLDKQGFTPHIFEKDAEDGSRGYKSMHKITFRYISEQNSWIQVQKEKEPIIEYITDAELHPILNVLNTAGEVNAVEIITESIDYTHRRYYNKFEPNPRFEQIQKTIDATAADDERKIVNILYPQQQQQQEYNNPYIETPINHIPNTYTSPTTSIPGGRKQRKQTKSKKQRKQTKSKKQRKSKKQKK